MKKFICVFVFINFVFVFTQTLEKPVAGKAKVYVFYFGGNTPVRNDIQLFLDKKYLGSIGSSYMKGLDIEPGKSVLWAKNLNKKWFLRLDVGAEKHTMFILNLLFLNLDILQFLDLFYIMQILLDLKKGKRDSKVLQKGLLNRNLQYHLLKQKKS